MKEPAVGLLVVALLVGGLLGFLLFRGQPVDPVTLFRVDTVLADTTRFQQQVDSAKAEVQKLTTFSYRTKARADQRVRWADSVVNAHDSMAGDSAHSEVTATSTVPKAAFDSLRVAYTTLDSAYAAQQQATASLLALTATQDTRIGSLTRSLGEAREALVKTKRPSRVGIGCAGGYGVGGTPVQPGLAVACGVTWRAF